MIFWWSSGSSRGSAVGIALIGLFAGVLMSVLFSGGSSTTRTIMLIIPVFLVSLPVVMMSLRRANDRSANAARPAAEPQKAKPKRGESLSELMSILNDEDIDDLRERVKARLEEQIDDANAEEIETFADLLAETKRKRGS
jgi:hypothetical protein